VIPGENPARLWWMVFGVEMGGRHGEEDESG